MNFNSMAFAAQREISTAPNLVVEVVPEIAWWVDLLAHFAATAFIVLLAVYFSKKIYTNHEFIKARISLIQDYAKELNDIFCFFQTVGHFGELEPTAIVERKRKMENLAHINRRLFSDALFNAHGAFMAMAFCEFQGPETLAKLRCDLTSLIHQPFVRGIDSLV